MPNNLTDYDKLNPLERGQLFKEIKEDESLSYQQLAEKIDKSASYIANSVRLTNLPIAIKDGLLGKVISEGHARALASLDNPHDCISVYKDVLKSHATVRETEQLVRDKKRKKKKKNQITQRQAKEIKDCLERILETEVKKIESKSLIDKLQLDIYLNS